MRRLPIELRDTVKEPIGSLARNDSELLRLLKGEHAIVSVGDRVTYTLLRNTIHPLIGIVDFIIERNPYSQEIEKTIRGFEATHIRVKNPSECISDELWDIIETCYHNREKGPFCIEVDGEEDLASLAAIYLAPSDVTVIYGLPNKGVVVVKATAENKRKVKTILDRM